MKLKPALLVIFFLVVWVVLKNYKSWYSDFQYLTKSPEGKTIDDKKQGEWKTYYLNGNLKTIETFKNDTLNGPSFSYNPDGTIRIRSTYRNGIQVDSLIMYHSNGTPNSAEWFDENGKSQGVFKMFHSNGNLSQIGKNKDGNLDDTCKTFYENGAIKTVEFYKNKMKNGTWRYYNENGRLTKTEVYKNDSLLKK